MIDVSHVNEIAVIKMDRPPANAIDAELLTRLDEAVQVETNSTATAIVLTGREGIFSAGVDLKRLIDGGEPYIRAFLLNLEHLLENLFFCPKPVVAAINGHAIAGGCVIACCADYRLMAADQGRIGVPELRVGVPFPVIITELMRAKVNGACFEDIMLGGATYAPAPACQAGLVDKLVDAGDLINKALDQAQSLAAIEPDIYALTKQQIRQPVRQAIDQAKLMYDQQIGTIWAAEDTRKLIQEYVSKTLKK